MAVVKNARKFKDLGIGQVQEPDRLPVDARPAFQLTEFLVDLKTKYFNKETNEGGILKFNGFDLATGEPIKCYTTSKVLLGQFKEIGEVIGYKEVKHEDNQIWNVLKEPLDIDGIEMVPSDVRGRKPYPKIIIRG